MREHYIGLCKILGTVVFIILSAVYEIIPGRALLENLRQKSAIPRPGWPRFWTLLGYAIPHKTRKTVYEPGRNDLLEDFLLTRKKYRTKWSRTWLQCCYTLWTVFLMADCWRVLFGSMSLRIFLYCIPGPLRRWWTLGVSGNDTAPSGDDGHNEG